MKNSMSDQMKEIKEARRLKGGFQSLWEIPPLTEEQIHKLNSKEKFCIRAKLWLFDWYPICVILLLGLSIIDYVLKILKTFTCS